jgi:hypothetical protein
MTATILDHLLAKVILEDFNAVRQRLGATQEKTTQKPHLFSDHSKLRIGYLEFANLANSCD